MELAASILAALVGTVFMTLSSTTEMHIEGREESTAPGKGAAFFLRFLGIEVEDGTAQMKILSTWVHWLYGAMWGVVWWLLVAVADLPLLATAALFFVIVWGAAAIHMPLTGVAPPPWTWGWKAVLIDWMHHLVYTAGTTVGWVWIERVAAGG